VDVQVYKVGCLLKQLLLVVNVPMNCVNQQELYYGAGESTASITVQTAATYGNNN
jgi:hypothetical protein